MIGLLNDNLIMIFFIQLVDQLFLLTFKYKPYINQTHCIRRYICIFFITFVVNCRVFSSGALGKMLASATPALRAPYGTCIWRERIR